MAPGLVDDVGRMQVGVDDWDRIGLRAGHSCCRGSSGRYKKRSPAATVVLDHFNMPLGTGLGRLQNKIFRIGHLGDFNDLMLAGTLSGVEMGLELAGVPHQKGGVAAALDYLTHERNRKARVPAQTVV